MGLAPSDLVRAVWVAILLLVLPVAAASHEGPRRIESTLPLGTGMTQLAGIDHQIRFADAATVIGFDLEGEVHWRYFGVFDASGNYHRLDVYAEPGKVAVPFVLTFRADGEPEHRFGPYGSSGTDCPQPCLPSLP